MNTAERTSVETDTRPGEVRTYRGRTVQELIPQIRAELGPGAMILRERQGLTGGVGGFFAKRCVEIDAQAAPGLSVYADDELDLSPGEQPTQPTPDPFAGFAARLEQAASGAFSPEALPDPFGPAVPRQTEPEPAPAAVLTADPSEPVAVFTAHPAKPAAVFTAQPAEPTAVELPVPILLDLAPPASGEVSVFRPLAPEADRGQAAAAPQPLAQTPGEVAAESSATAGLRARLTDHGLSRPFADRLIADAARAAGSEDEAMLTVAAQAALAAMLPRPAALPVDGGVIAVVGAGASGKTRAVAALATACARAGHSVTVARLAGADHDELAELLEDGPVELLPAMKTKATVRAVNAAREEDLVILDTPATTPGDDGAREALAGTLARLSPDAVLLCTPATFTQRALANLLEHHAELRIDALIATHGDQAGMLGTVAELSVDTRIPLGHVHSGLEITTALTSVDPATIASQLLR